MSDDYLRINQVFVRMCVRVSQHPAEKEYIVHALFTPKLTDNNLGGDDNNFAH